MTTAELPSRFFSILRAKSSLRRTTVFAVSLVLAVVTVTFGPVGGAAFAAQSVDQCNGAVNTGGKGLTCDVTVTNNLNIDTGIGTSVVTTKACLGDANKVPSSCVGPTTTLYNTLTTSISQCNGAANGGGSSVICSVHVVNNVTGGATPTPATVNQCNGSGQGGGTAPTLNCDPSPATTTGATITQCNGSVNGGGAPTRVTCTVASGPTQSAQLAVTVNQCNDSANGGGSVVTCSTEFTALSLQRSSAPGLKRPSVSG